MPTLTTIIDRYYSDSSFRSLISTDSEMALAGYDLSSSDRQSLNEFLADPQAYLSTEDDGRHETWL
jgi:hypothetical protein